MDNQGHPTMNRKKGWAILCLVGAGLYLFAVKIGPWLQHKIWGMDQIARTIEENNIDAGAYYYTEIEGAADGYQYLNQTLQTMAPDQYGVTLPFLAGIALCLLILYFGMRALPRK